MDRDQRHIIDDTAIEAVTVHRRGATVTRRITLGPIDGALPRRISLVGLPLTLQAPTVRIAVARIEGEGNVVAGTPRVSLHARPPESVVEPPEAAAVREARQACERTDAHYAQLEAELSMLDALTVEPRATPEDGRIPRPSPMETRLALVAFADGLGSALHAELAKLKITRTAQRATLAAMVDQARRASSAQVVDAAAVTGAIQVDLDVEGAPSGVELIVRYLVPGARWVPAWQVRLDRDGTAARIEMRAHVVQRSGEDWSNVSLRLSTANPARFAALPELKSVRIGKAQAPPPAQRGFRPPPAGSGALFADFDSARRRLEPRAPSGGTAPRVPALALPDAPRWSPPVVTMGYGGAMEDDAEYDEMSAPMPASAPPPAMARSASRGAPPPSPKRKRSKPVPRAPRAPGAMATRSGMLREEAFGGGGAPPEPVRAAVLFGALRLPPSTDAGRGSLRAEDRPAEWRAALTGGGRRLAHDPAVQVTQAQLLARSVDGLAVPDGTHPVENTTGAYDYVWDAAAPVDLPADGAWHSVPVHEREAECALRYVTVPRESAHVFRLASLENPLSAPLLSGPAEIYVDGAYVLSTRLPTVPPGGRFDLGLGVEQSIRCARNTHFTESRSDARVVAMAELHHAISIELRNGLGRPADVEVRERIPQPSDGAEVVVEESAIEPSWTPYVQEERGRPLVGGRRWRVEVAPGETRTLEATYVVKIYAANELVGGNRREA